MHPVPDAIFNPRKFTGSKRTCGYCGGLKDEHLFGQICDIMIIEERIKNDGSGRKVVEETSDYHATQRTSSNNRRIVRRSILPAELR